MIELKANDYISVKLSRQRYLCVYCLGDSYVVGHRLCSYSNWHVYVLVFIDIKPYTLTHWCLSIEHTHLFMILCSDVTKFAFKFDVRTSNVLSRFEIRQIFSRTHRRIRTSGLHDRHHISTPTGRRNKCALPNSLKGPKIILDVADHQGSKDGPFRIIGNALTYLLSDFFGITFLHFLSC